MELCNNQFLSINPFCLLIGNTGWRMLDSLVYKMGRWGLQRVLFALRGGSGRGPVIIIARVK